jgi:hypothetical protein
MNQTAGSAFTVDIGKGNLCSNCHQPRPYSWYAELFGTGTEMAITTSRFGPHHGPQSTMLTGQGGYEYAGETYVSSAHLNAAQGCVTCHMATPAYADEAGGHTWWMEYDDHGTETLWVKGCGATGCHDVSTSALEDVLRDEAATERALIWDDVDANGEIGAVLDVMGGPDTGLLVDLKVLLVQIAVLLGDDSAVDDDLVMWPLDVAGAVYNYNFVREDLSRGLHNFKYATKLLTTSIAAIEAYILTLPPQ